MALTTSRLEPLKSTKRAAIPLGLIVGYGFMERDYAKLAKGPEAFASIIRARNVDAAPYGLAYQPH